MATIIEVHSRNFEEKNYLQRKKKEGYEKQRIENIKKTNTFLLFQF